MTLSSSATLALSIHGPAGALDLVVPAAATSVDVAREYAQQADLPGIPLLQTPLGDLIDAGRSLAEAGVVSGDVLVATSGVHRPRTTAAHDTALEASDNPAFASLVATVAVGFAVLAASYAARAGDDVVRTITVAVLLACALLGVLPLGRHARQRSSAAPAFGAAAAVAALYEPGAHLLPAIVAAAGLSAAVVATISRALATRPDEATTVWIASGVVAGVAGGVSPTLGWPPQVSWALVVILAMLAARSAPSLAIDVPDDALLDLDRLAVTAWSARDTGRKSRRARLVVAGEAISRLVEGASRTVTAASVAILVAVGVGSPLLLRSAVLDLDRIGARCLVFFAGASILFAARAYRHAAARALLRVAGLLAWLALGVELADTASSSDLAAFLAVVLVLGAVMLAAAVASGRGWRSVWWSRRAEVGEALCGSFALAAAVVASGAFRALWEISS